MKQVSGPFYAFYEVWIRNLPLYCQMYKQNFCIFAEIPLCDYDGTESSDLKP